MMNDDKFVADQKDYTDVETPQEKIDVIKDIIEKYNVNVKQ